MNTSETPLNTPESWEEATKIASLVGDVHSSFLSAIHFLKKDLEENNGETTHITRYILKRLLRSDAFKAPLYYLARSVRKKELQQGKLRSANGFLDIYQADELQAAVTLIYLYRRVRRGCDKEQWDWISQRICLETEIAGVIGRAIPRMGSGYAMMLAGSQMLGTAMLLGMDKNQFAKYTKRLEKSGGRSDLEFEAIHWKCTHLQIGVLLMQKMGIGGDFNNSIVQSLSRSYSKNGPLQEELYRHWITNLWTRTLAETGKIPDMTHRGEYYPLQEQLDELLELSQEIRGKSGFTLWLEKGKQDVSPQVTPELFADSGDSGTLTDIEQIPHELLEKMRDPEFEEIVEGLDEMDE